MSSRQIAQRVSGQVRPVLSLNGIEARRRVLNLYRAWFRQIPLILHDFELPVSEIKMKQKLRELFLQNQNVKDIRAIDMLVIKGQMELNETVLKFKQTCHVMNYFKTTIKPKPKDFISKFLAGKDSE